MEPKKSRAYEQTSGVLSAQLLPMLDAFIGHYKFPSLKRHGKQSGSPRVFVELLFGGTARWGGSSVT